MERTVAITGGTKGIGLAVARAFAQAGWTVLAGARSAGRLAEDAPGVRFVEMDAASDAGHAALVEAALAATGRLDCYVNNAGRSAWRPIGQIDEAFLDEMLAVNLKGAFWGCKQAARVMEAGASILNMSSLAAKRGTPSNAAYCAAKFGMTGLTQAMCKELGPQGIRVNAICPVLVRTPGLIEALEVETSPAKGDPDTFLETFRQTQTALGRLPTGEEVAAMALFLASDAASAVTGQSINVDCGVLPQ